MMVAEALGLLFFCWSRFGLAGRRRGLHTFSFLTLLYLAVFSILSARERRRFWATSPSRPLVAALLANVLLGTGLVLAGIPGLVPLSWRQTLVVFAYAMVSCLVVNDAIKVALIGRYVPALTPRISEASVPLTGSEGES